jgi:hypothetical protein
MEVTLVGESSPRAMPMALTLDALGKPVVTTSAPATGASIYKESLHCTYQAISLAAATIIIEASNDNINWVPVTGVTASSTITLAGAGTGGFVDPVAAAWRYVRARTTAATTATNVWMGV